MSRIESAHALRVIPRKALRSLWPLLLLFASGASLVAQPTWESLSPSGFARGTEGLLTVEGQGLQAVYGILSSDPGVKLLEIVSKEPRKLVLKLAIAPTARLGAALLHLAGDNGSSRVLSLAIGSFREVTATTASAEPQSLPVTIDGRFRSGEEERFALHLEAGLHSFEVCGLRLGSGVDCDPMMRLETEAGETIFAVDDDLCGRLDPFVTVAIEKAGTYLLHLRDAQWRGGSRYRYRVHIGAGPRPLAFRISQKEGGEELVGQALGILNTEEVQAAEWRFDHPIRPEAYRQRPGGEIWPVPLAAFAPDEAATHLFDGIVTEQQEDSTHRFRAKAGQRLDIKVLARAYDSPLDAVLTILDIKESVLSTTDDARGALDPTTTLRVRADGEYRVQVRDRIGRTGTEFFYRVHIAEAKEAMAANFERSSRYAPANLNIPAGGRAALMLNLSGQNSRAEPPTLAGLPEGVTQVFAHRVQGTPQAFYVLEARPEARPAISAARLMLTPGGDAATAFPFLSMEPSVVVENDRILQAEPLDALPIAVRSAAPFHIEVDSPTRPIISSSSFELSVRVVRSAGFTRDITLRLLQTTGGLRANRPTVRGSATSGTLTIEHRGARPTTPFPLIVFASASVNGEPVEVASAPFDLQVIPRPLNIAVGEFRGPRGAEGSLSFELSTKEEWQKDLKILPRGLPRGVTLEWPPLDRPGRHEVKVRFAADAPFGAHQNLSFRAVWTTEGGPLWQDFRGGSLRIDPPAATSDDAQKTPKRLGTVENPKT